MIFLRQGQMCVPMHLYGENVEKSFSQNVLKTNGSLGEERANLSAFRTFVRFLLVWICRFPLPRGVWEGLRFVIVALPGLFSYLFFFFFFFFFFFLQRVMKVVKQFSYNQNFVPEGLSALAPGQYTSVKLCNF